MRLPRASPHRSQQLSLPPRIPTGGGGHGQQPRQPGEAEPGGRELPHGESGAAAASEGPGAGPRHTPRHYDTAHAPGIALDCCQDCCQRGKRFRTASDGHRTAPQVNGKLGHYWTARPVLRIRRLGVRIPPSAPRSEAMSILSRVGKRVPYSNGVQQHDQGVRARPEGLVRVPGRAGPGLASGPSGGRRRVRGVAAAASGRARWGGGGAAVGGVTAASRR